MIDITVLALQTTQFLTPFIPYLIKGGIEAAKSAAGKVGELSIEKGWEKAQAMWSKFVSHDEIKKTAEIVAKHPDDADAQASLRLQIKLALAADETLAATLEKLLSEPGEKRTVTAQGNRSIAIGGNASNNIIITGDHNKARKP